MSQLALITPIAGHDLPGFGGGRPQPPDPGYGIPGIGGGRPDNSLPPEGGYVWGTLIRWLMRPQIDNDPAKPPGLRPIAPLPPSPGHPGNKPPNSGRPPHAGWPGHWEPIDPGFGKPPVWGFVPSIDNGLPEPPVEVGGGPSTPPPTHWPKPPGGETKPPGGAWVPTDPDFGKPVRPCPPAGGKPHPPIWAWIPDRPEVEPPIAEGGGGEGTATATVEPTSGTVLASGGALTLSVYPSTTTPAWTVTGVPDWITAAPMSGSGQGTVVLTVAPNTTGLPKQAFVKIGGATFTVNQGAV
jgi:hypothetical protein